MRDRIHALRRNQVQDVSRTGFRVGVRVARNQWGDPLFYRSKLVYQDAFGDRYTVTP